MRFAGLWDGWKDFMDERMIKKEEEDVWRYWKWEWELIGVESVSKKKEKRTNLDESWSLGMSDRRCS